MCRFGVDVTGLEEVHDNQADGDCDGSTEAVVGKGFEPHAADAFFGTQVHDSGDDGADDERHDYHFERVHEELADELTEGFEADAEAFACKRKNDESE